MVNPSLIHSNKLTQKSVSFLLKRSKHCSEIFMRVHFWSAVSKHGTHLAQSVFISNSSCKNIFYTFFWNAYSLSNFMHFYLLVIQYHILHLFIDLWCCCTFWMFFTWIIFKARTATFKLGSPFLSCWKRRRRVPINFYELSLNFIWHETFFYEEFYICTILSFIYFKGYRQHSCFRQMYKTNYLIEWRAISHGCLWQMYQLREKNILLILLPPMVEVENFSDHTRI